MTSREGFVPAINSSAAAGGFSNHKTYGVKYICASCAATFTLGKSESIRCKECGHRVIYKARTKRMVQFEAR
ncbi:DNA-directed RNA polymerase core subunit [Saccharomycopsis crataegensis]|uniref:DNA-directed RNA polymerase core subunit n=1 Tax=Saccharomycopsis crataegensis TaxID=43959 RepID=A0AAV5QX37_9ASCO|nr:DNA-directed RNA polymerase core subunit [Saccharomycopsis crataegensis]